MSSSYIPIRDDAGSKSLSRVERVFITEAAALATTHRRRSLRLDGRAWNQLRAQRVSLQRWENGSSATIQWGAGTRVHCVCSATLAPPPYVDRPAEGSMQLSVDLSPAASTTFRQSQLMSTTVSGGGGASHRVGGAPDPTQKLLTNRILRCLERILILGNALDTEALCVTPGQWVWKLSLAVTIVDAAGGNLIDASTLACMAALRHYRKPQLEKMTVGEGSTNNNSNTSHSSAPPKLIPADIKEPTPLPIHHTPLSVSFALLPLDADANMHSSTHTTTDHGSSRSSPSVAILVDPNAREELAIAKGSSTTSLTIAMNIHGEVCLLDFGGACELLPSQLKECANVAKTCICETLCPALERTLKDADEQAQLERLERLKRQLSSQLLPPTVVAEDGTTPLISSSLAPTGIPFWQEQSETHVETSMSAEEDGNNNKHIQDQVEEALRRQALDYNLAHVPSKVRENDDDSAQQSNNSKSRNHASAALLNALMQSVQQETSTDEVAKQTATVQTMEHKQVQPVAKVQHIKSTTGSSIPATAAPVVDVALARLDSDEEDVTMELTSEFASDLPIVQPVAPTPMQVDPQVAAADKDDDDDDVDDLAAAIKKKSKKKKK